MRCNIEKRAGGFSSIEVRNGETVFTSRIARIGRMYIYLL